jgi:putative transposase
MTGSPAIFIVKAATVIGWHRKGFRLFWDWKIRHGKPGRPSVPKEVRQLIRTMSRENPLWGAPRIHGELLKLGIDIGETSVSKYLVRRHKPSVPPIPILMNHPNHQLLDVDLCPGGGRGHVFRCHRISARSAVGASATVSPA